MKKIAVSILVLVFFITSALSYLGFGGGLDKYWPVVGESIKQVRNGFYYPFGFSIEAANKMRVRQGVEFGTQNEGLAQVSLFDGRALVTLLGNSKLTVSDVLLAKASPASAGRDGAAPAGNATGQAPSFMPGMDNPSSQVAAAANSKQPLDMLVLSDFIGIAFVELYSPLIIRFDGGGVIGNGLRLRLVPYSEAKLSAGKELQYPVRLLLFKPEKRRGMESIICLNLPEGLNLEVWLNDYRGYAMGRQTQFSFNRTPGVMETNLLSESDNKKLIRWLQVEGVWSGAAQPESLNLELRQTVRGIFDDSLEAVSANLSADTLAEMKALVYEWWMLGWISNKAEESLHAPKPVMSLEPASMTPPAQAPTVPGTPAVTGGNQTIPAQAPSTIPAVPGVAETPATTEGTGAPDSTR